MTSPAPAQPRSHVPTLIAVVGIVLGLAVTWFAGRGTTSSTLLLAVGGFLAVGGALAAVLLHLHRRLVAGGQAPTRGAGLIGIASGVVAIGVALALETLANDALGKGGVLDLALSGPIEETGKLLLPIILLAAGVAAVRQVGSGVWAVAVSGAVFGIVEGVKYAARVGLTTAQEEHIDKVAALLPGITSTLASAAFIYLSWLLWYRPQVRKAAAVGS